MTSSIPKVSQPMAVAVVAVVGLPFEAWGDNSTEALRQAIHEQLGKTQRLSALRWMNELPRSAIGKVLKRELRDTWNAHAEPDPDPHPINNNPSETT